MKRVIPRSADSVRLDAQVLHFFIRDPLADLVATTFEHRLPRSPVAVSAPSM